MSGHSQKLTNPPKMPLFVLIILVWLTGGAYAAIQLWVQARWMRRTLDVDVSYKWASALLLVTVFGLLKLFASAYLHQTRNPPFDWVQGVLMVSGLVSYLGTTSCMKGELGRAPLTAGVVGVASIFPGPAVLPIPAKPFDCQEAASGLVLPVGVVTPGAAGAYLLAHLACSWVAWKVPSRPKVPMARAWESSLKVSGGGSAPI
jgi:hypothetical protein